MVIAIQLPTADEDIQGGSKKIHLKRIEIDTGNEDHMEGGPEVRMSKTEEKTGSNSKVKKKESTTTITLHYSQFKPVIQTCSLPYAELGGKASPNSSNNADSRVAGHRKTREHNPKCIHPTKI